jgi:hypothetical protein
VLRLCSRYPGLFSWQFYSFDAIAHFSIAEVKGFFRYVANSQAFDFSEVSPVMQRHVFTSFCKGSLVIHLGFAIFQLFGFGNFGVMNFSSNCKSNLVTHLGFAVFYFYVLAG